MSVDITLTSLEDVLNDTTKKISDYRLAFDAMAEAASDYISEYETYIDSRVRDASRLKKRMKKVVLTAVSDAN